ncbi:hypothetical protein AV654_04790 [Paenibacillus elgii]|uniref:Uncharacterized protein n=1 Tax=Paenibacillus elgii TaxID=189691 RepID=A0A163U5H7_9BACL|nr:hypothetical protein AV654_04790 [Paenibacillus elgii]
MGKESLAAATNIYEQSMMSFTSLGFRRQIVSKKCRIKCNTKKPMIYWELAFLTMICKFQNKENK